MGCDGGRPPEKHVEIDKTTQTLTAYEGDQVVLVSRVSTGRSGRSTPTGLFHAGAKYLMHYSSRYHHAPMPSACRCPTIVSFHGYRDVPLWPASHGCIRMPLSEENPARSFYEWAETGMPIRISGEWIEPKKAPHAPSTKL